jgi:hypothetical protein
LEPVQPSVRVKYLHGLGGVQWGGDKRLNTLFTDHSDLEAQYLWKGFNNRKPDALRKNKSDYNDEAFKVLR